jgi:hypothetical protein
MCKIWIELGADVTVITSPYDKSDIVANKLVETFAEYKEDIKKIDFKIDVERLKKDIQNQSNDFFK